MSEVTQESFPEGYENKQGIEDLIDFEKLKQ
jgi:hypothetical protein